MYEESGNDVAPVSFGLRDVYISCMESFELDVCIFAKCPLDRVSIVFETV